MVPAFVREIPLPYVWRGRDDAGDFLFLNRHIFIDLTVQLLQAKFHRIFLEYL